MQSWISKLNELEKTGQPLIIATLVQSSGATPREAGAKMIILQSGEFFGTIGGGEFEKKVLDDAKMIFENETAITKSYDLFTEKGEGCGGTAVVLFEVINQGPHLYIFGAGHVGLALCRVLHETPFVVHLVDEREEWVFSRSVSDSVIRHREHWKSFIEHLRWNKDKTYIAIMTPHHKFDQHVLELVINQPTRYVGLMGSKNKWQSIRDQLIEKGIQKSDLNRVHCPIGIPVGGKSPPEIAISISAELLKIYYEK